MSPPAHTDNPRRTVLFALYLQRCRQKLAVIASEGKANFSKSFCLRQERTGVGFHVCIPLWVWTLFPEGPCVFSPSQLISLIPSPAIYCSAGEKYGNVWDRWQMRNNMVLRR